MNTMFHFEVVAKIFVDMTDRKLKLKPGCLGVICAEILTGDLLVELPEREREHRVQIFRL